MTREEQDKLCKLAGWPTITEQEEWNEANEERYQPTPDELRDFYINDCDAGSCEGEDEQ
jgi:hypothetical protein